jgi:hypothetical protein
MYSSTDGVFCLSIEVLFFVDYISFMCFSFGHTIHGIDVFGHHTNFLVSTLDASLPSHLVHPFENYCGVSYDLSRLLCEKRCDCRIHQKNKKTQGKLSSKV